MTDQEIGAQKPRLSLFSPYSWIAALSPWPHSGRFYNLIIGEYLVISSAATLPLGWALLRSSYERAGTAIGWMNILVLVIMMISFRRCVIVTEETMQRELVVRIAARVFEWVIAAVFLLSLLVVARNPSPIDSQKMLSFSGAMWLCLRVVVRSHSMAVQMKRDGIRDPLVSQAAGRTSQPGAHASKALLVGAIAFTIIGLGPGWAAVGQASWPHVSAMISAVDTKCRMRPTSGSSRLKSALQQEVTCGEVAEFANAHSERQWSVQSVHYTEVSIGGANPIDTKLTLFDGELKVGDVVDVIQNPNDAKEIRTSDFVWRGFIAAAVPEIGGLALFLIYWVRRKENRQGNPPQNGGGAPSRGGSTIPARAATVMGARSRRTFGRQ